MFGHLPLVFQRYIVEQYGDEKWNEIKKLCGIKYSLDEHKQLDDNFLETIIQKAVFVLGEDEDLFLLNVGSQYITCLRECGHNPLLRVLGSTFLEFIQNLDFVHSTTLSDYPNANIPFFRIDIDSTARQILLHYYSRFNFLGKFVEGILQTIAKEYFKKRLVFKIISESDEVVDQPNFLHNKHHVIFSITVSDIKQSSEDRPTMVAQSKKHSELQIQEDDIEQQKQRIADIVDEYGEDALPVNQAKKKKDNWDSTVHMAGMNSRVMPIIPQTLSVTAQAFCTIFPYHFVFDDKMHLKQAGVYIQQILPAFRRENTDITKHLLLLHPSRVEFCFENVRRFETCPHVIQTKENRLMKANSRSQFVCLRGQMIYLADKNFLLYMCSPYVCTINDLDEQGVCLSDIPTHDLTKYLLINNATNMKEDWMAELLGLNDNQNKIRAVSRNNFITNGDDSGDDKPTTSNAKNGRNLNSSYSSLDLLPRDIAVSLKKGEKIETKIYNNVCILFSDVVNFDKIMKSSKPKESIDMLNALHTEFDKLIHVHGLFRVEIIGDAYVVASGIPNLIRSRTERIANMSLAMIMVSENIASPYDYGPPFGKRAVIRVGIHSGPVIGGIIGTKFPRFTIIGDTVVTASRLESHGEPGEIQLSPVIFKELKSEKYEISERGSIEIRGLGRMFTYFLVKNKDAPPEMLMGHKNSNEKYNSKKRGGAVNNKVQPITELVGTAKFHYND